MHAPAVVDSHGAKGTHAWRAVLTAVWRFVREVSGDAAYETYARRAGRNVLSREAFWLDALRRRYDRISRCC